MKFITIAFATGLLVAEGPSDTDKLLVRDAQLKATAAYADVLQAQITYQQAVSTLQAKLAELTKKYACEIDATTLECKPKAPEKPKIDR